MEIIEQIGAYAGLAAIVGLALLSALYFSQARDVRRLREWAGKAPERTSEPAAQAPRVEPRPVPRPPGAGGATGNVRPVPAANSTGAAATGVPAATTAAARAAEARSRVTPRDPLSQNTMAHPPPAPAVQPPGEAEGEALPNDELEEGPPGNEEPGHDELEDEGLEEEELAREDLEDEEGLGDEELAQADLEEEEPRADEELAREDLEDEELGTHEEPGDEREGDELDDGYYEDEPDGETEDRPAVPGPAPVAAATAAARRPTLPRPPAAPARPVPAPTSSGGSILPPYECSRPGGDPWHRRISFPPGRAALVIVAGVVVLAAATLGGLQLAAEDSEPDPPRAGQVAGETPAEGGEGSAGQPPAPRPQVDPGSVTVAVLNATTIQGAAANLGDTVASEGYRVGTVSNFTDVTRAESVVLYASGAEREAESVSRRLDIPQQEQIDPESQGLAGDASVVILVGADKAQ